MTKNQLLKYFPEQTKQCEMFSENPGIAFRSPVGLVVEAITEAAFYLQDALLNELGYESGVAPAGPLKIEYLMNLPLEKKEKIEFLTHRMMGYWAYFFYFGERVKDSKGSMTILKRVNEANFKTKGEFKWIVTKARFDQLESKETFTSHVCRRTLKGAFGRLKMKEMSE